MPSEPSVDVGRLAGSQLRQAEPAQQAMTSLPTAALFALLADADSHRPSSLVVMGKGGRKLAQTAGLMCERQWFGTVSSSGCLCGAGRACLRRGGGWGGHLVLGPAEPCLALQACSIKPAPSAWRSWLQPPTSDRRIRPAVLACSPLPAVASAPRAGPRSSARACAATTSGATPSSTATAATAMAPISATPATPSLRRRCASAAPRRPQRGGGLLPPASSSSSRADTLWDAPAAADETRGPCLRTYTSSVT